jgi:hypothetical protein
MIWEAFGSQTRLPRGLSRRSAAARLLGFEYYCGYKTFTSCECCVLCRGVQPSAYVSMSAAKCNNNPPHLQWVCRRGTTENYWYEDFVVQFQVLKRNFSGETEEIHNEPVRIASDVDEIRTCHLWVTSRCCMNTISRSTVCSTYVSHLGNLYIVHSVHYW